MAGGMDSNPEDSREAFGLLRQLLLKPEIEKLAEISRRLDDPEVRAAEVGQILAAALRRQAAVDDRLCLALRPLIEKTLYNSVRKNPRALVDIIFPVMGPALRKSVSAAIMGMIQSLNQMANHCLTIRGIKWRLEAWKSGKPFSAVVLAHTLLFRVEQVFLIHAESGLVLQHVAAEGVSGKDPDLVSGMFTAIQDFVKDALGSGSELIDTLRLGNQRSIWLEQGRYAILAAVIRGTPPMDLRHDIQDCLDRIEAVRGQALAAFDGDTAPFENLDAELRGLLQFQARPETGRRTWLLPAAIATLVTLAALALGLNRYQENRTWQRLLERLRSQPGIIVTRAAREDGRYLVEGLRDPLAPDPESIKSACRAAKLPVDWRWKAYWTMDRPFVLKRAELLLKPPPSVRLLLEGGILSARGYASHSWIVRARRLASVLPGLAGYNDGQVVDQDLVAFQKAVQRLESKAIYFVKGGIDLDPGQEPNLDDVASIVRTLQGFDFPDRPGLNIAVIGHTDVSGTEKFNLALSRLRAEKVVSLLAARGLEAGLFNPLGLGPAGTGSESQALWRSVTFGVR